MTDYLQVIADGFDDTDRDFPRALEVDRALRSGGFEVVRADELEQLRKALAEQTEQHRRWKNRAQNAKHKLKKLRESDTVKLGQAVREVYGIAEGLRWVTCGNGIDAGSIITPDAADLAAWLYKRAGVDLPTT